MAEGIRFTKMQAVGNDFVLIDAREGAERDWPSLAVILCPRNRAVGADGLLIVEQSDSADVRMRMYNPDGTEDVCGNGMRCVARYVADDRRPTTDHPTTQGPNDPSTLKIETLAGIRVARMVDSEGAIWTVDMGAPRFAPAEIPMLVDSARVIDYPIEVLGRRIPVTALSTGTTHAVMFVIELPGDEEFLRLSAALENHPLFPERTSVMWTRVTDSANLELRIWERGAGETWGCGTGACAAAVAAILHGLTESPVKVESRGGILTVEWSEGEPMRLTGPAEYVYRGLLLD